MSKYVGGKKASEILGVHIQTLYNWDRQGKIETIRTPGGHRKYNVEKYLRNSRKNIDEEMNDNKVQNDNEGIKIEKDNGRINLCYIRVSTVGQKDDLKRQKEYMRERYPDYELIEDIGSGINFNRKGLRRIIKLAISGKVNKLVVAYKDRLTRFGFDLIEDLIKEYSKGEIIINGIKKEKEPQDELVEDVLQILNVYTAKLNGLRKYKKNASNK